MQMRMHIWRTILLPLVVLALPLFAAEETERTMLLPEVSIMNPSDFTLNGQRYVVPYAESLPGLPVFSVGYTRRVYDTSNLQVTWESRLGYAIKQGVFSLKSAGGETVDTLTFQFVPAMTLLRGSYEIPGFSFGKPSLGLGGGMTFVSQRGNVAGINENFWIPFMVISPAFTFLEGRKPDDWLGGFTFGTTFFRSLGRQSIAGFSIDLSLQVLL